MAKQRSASKLWRLLTIICTGLLIFMTVVNIVSIRFETTINWFFNTASSTSTSVGPNGEVYYKSEFTKKDADGKTLLDSKGKEVYDNGALSLAGNELAKDVTAEGFVLLYNNGTLPLVKNTTISLFGQSVDNPITSGTGSGQTSGSDATFVSSLTLGGFNVNMDSYNFYDSGEGGSYRLSVPGMHDANPFTINEVPWSVVSSSADFAKMTACDTAVVVFSRNGGEGYDLSSGANEIGYDFGIINVSDARTIQEGSLTGNNYLELNSEERDLLSGLKGLKDNGKIQNIVVILNSSNAIQLDFLSEDVGGVDYGIDACMWLGATGQSGLDSLGKLLSGDITPSGHLVDTFCYDNLREPSIYNFGHNAYENFESEYRAQADAEHKDAWFSEKYYNVYLEGIYVGYRYYETRYEDMVLGNTTDFDYSNIVAYSFGHGLSYADFEYSGFSVKDNSVGTMTATVTVTNKSTSVSGKEVVQLYAQTPYTDYDKANGIEKSSIELVGFEKTKTLAPGESETVFVTFHKELLAVYDAYGAKTYIMDAGDYYLSLGNGAHDALNNILTMKGANASNMVPAVAPIKSVGGVVHKWTLNALDTTTYAISSSTGVEITNRFDNADINLYDANQKVNYITRENWNESFDISSLESMKSIAVKLDMTDKMYSDVKAEQYTPPADAASYRMPTLGADNGLKLVMFKGVALDGSIELNGKTYTWDDLLDQVTMREMRDLIAYGQHTTKPVISVAKPGTSDHNGPLGFNSTFVGGGKGTAYPAPCVRAATWNKELTKRVGELIGEDGLHSNVNGLYGPGANTHRNAYSGRNFEYYSEDPVVSSLIGAEECEGIQSKGIIVYEKHFALNDSESHREGIGTWVNEQAIREIYLEAFRGIMKVDGGNAHAAMSGFNRLGTIWCGDSSELMNDVLRGEWGFDGFIVTDADACGTKTHCTLYMYAPRAIVSGTDLFDGVNNHDRSGQLSSFSSDPYVVNAMRESTERILYSVANSAAMNGLSADTTVKLAMPWWKVVLVTTLGVTAVGAVGSATMYVLDIKGIVKFPKYKDKTKAE